MRKHNEHSWENGGISPSPFNSCLTVERAGRSRPSLCPPSFLYVRLGAGGSKAAPGELR